MTVRGVRVHGKADRIDRLADGNLAIVDYKTGGPPSGAEVEAGYALQLGTLGLIAAQGGFAGIDGEPRVFEYWSLGKSKDSDTGFGYVRTPLKVGAKRSCRKRRSSWMMRSTDGSWGKKALPRGSIPMQRSIPLTII